MALEDEIQAKVETVARKFGENVAQKRVKAVCLAAILDDGAGSAEFVTMNVSVQYPLALIGLLGELEAQLRASFRASHQPDTKEETAT